MIRLRSSLRPAFLAPALPLAMAALAACSTPGLAPPATADSLPAPAPLAPGLALATFDSVALHVARTHYDPDMGGLDWSGISARYRASIDESTDLRTLYQVITSLLDELETSHYTLLPGDWMGSAPANPGDPGAEGALETGVDVRLVEGAVRVTRVAPGSPGELAGLVRGDEILTLDELDVVAEVASLLDGGRAPVAQDRADELSRLGLVSGIRHRLQSPASSEPIRVMVAPGQELLLTPAPSATPRVGFGTLLPPMVVEVAASQVPLVPGPGCGGVLALTAWHPGMMAPMEAALRDLESCQGIVLDLRGNPGGILALMVPTAAQFLEEAGTLGSLRTRDTEMHFRATPRRVRSDASLAPAFPGPVAILVDELSMSTSEMFASGMQALGRARVFGVRTPGMALPARTLLLPTGDYLMFAFADYTDGAGRRIEARGVTPDIITPLTREALLLGRDDALAVALEWIRQASPDPGPTSPASPRK
jgi:carboxyl-terminal processing protease